MQQVIEEYKKLKQSIKNDTAQAKVLRAQIIDYMDKESLNILNYNTGTAKISYSVVFDKSACKLNNKEEYDEFSKTEIVSSTVETFNEVLFKHKYPGLFRVYQTKTSPRLTVK